MTGPAKEIEAAAARRPSVLYAPGTLAEATALLADLYAAGERHGIAPGVWTGQGADLPGHALGAVAARYRRARASGEAATAYRRLADALTEAGVAPAGTYQGRVLLPRRETTPSWGWSGEAALTVGFYADEGWTLELAQERTPVIDVVAPTEAAVADLAARVVTGRHPDPFPAAGGPRRGRRAAR